MKKLLPLAILFMSCAQDKIEPIYTLDQTTFDKKSIVVADKASITFDLPSSGIYDMVIVDEMSGDIVTRERFKGIEGVNSLYIYTRSINKGSYYLRLMNENKVINTLNIKL